MRKSKAAMIVMFLLVFALAVFLLLIIPDQMTDVTKAQLICDCAAFLSQIVLFLFVARELQSAKGKFENAPVMTVSGIYLFLVFAFSTACAVFQSSLSVKAVLITNVVLFAAAWVTIIALLGSKGHQRKVDSRQKDHHTAL